MNNKEFQIVVLAKQVPDTHNVGKDAMKEDGTINRAALPAIFNPDDLKALESNIINKLNLCGCLYNFISIFINICYRQFHKLPSI